MLNGTNLFLHDRKLVFLTRYTTDSLTEFPGFNRLTLINSVGMWLDHHRSGPIVPRDVLELCIDFKVSMVR